MRLTMVASALLLALASALNDSETSALVADLSNITHPFGIPLSDIANLTASVENVVGNVLQGLVGTLLPTDPNLQYYGLSPPVYPTPNASGTGDWADAFEKARALVARMTTEEKGNITLGQSSTQGCSGFTGSVPRLGFPGICLSDAENGVRGGNLVSGYPAQIHVGASWNRTLAGLRGEALGKEFAGKGINVLLGPVVGPIGRIAKGGRNWEGFGSDPYLSGALVVPTVQGVQQSVVACIKHFLANEQETNRQPFLLGQLGEIGQQSVSANVDDRTLHELYLWPFYDALKAGAGSVMASYQRTNNSYSSQNSKLLNGLLKTELGFEGFVVSDWNGVHTGIASNNAGLDMAMPNSPFLDPSKIAAAVNNGSLSTSRLDDQATRIVAAWYRFAQFADPGMDGHADDVQTAEGQAINFQSAVEGHVLVKNTNHALPLDRPNILNLFGYDGPGGKNTSAQGPILSIVGAANTQRYPDGRPFTALDLGLLSLSAEPDNSGPAIALDGTMITGIGSGAATPTSSYSPADAFAEQAALDNTTLYTDFSSPAPRLFNPTVQSPSDPCIVFINAQSGETWDRSTLADSYSDDLVVSIASQCSNTTVVIHNAGTRLVDNWIDHENITAVIYAHLPGQESGRALVELMYGRQSPSGRLPYTVARSESDYGNLLNPTQSSDMFPQSDFSEGVSIDYKHFVANNITPRYPFGFGLTYSTFNYSSLQITHSDSASAARLPLDASTSPIPQGGLDSLYDVLATVTATITNTGNTPAAEVAQLYLGIPNSGVSKQLRGFDKKSIQPGDSATVEFPLRRRDLSVWNVVQQQWALQEGSYEVMVGKDVLDIHLTGQLSFS